MTNRVQMGAGKALKSFVHNIIYTVLGVCSLAPVGQVRSSDASVKKYYLAAAGIAGIAALWHRRSVKRAVQHEIESTLCQNRRFDPQQSIYKAELFRNADTQRWELEEPLLLLKKSLRENGCFMAHCMQEFLQKTWQQKHQSISRVSIYGYNSPLDAAMNPPQQGKNASFHFGLQGSTKNVFKTVRAGVVVHEGSHLFECCDETMAQLQDDILKDDRKFSLSGAVDAVLPFLGAASFLACSQRSFYLLGGVATTHILNTLYKKLYKHNKLCKALWNRELQADVLFYTDDIAFKHTQLSSCMSSLVYLAAHVHSNPVRYYANGVSHPSLYARIGHIAYTYTLTSVRVGQLCLEQCIDKNALVTLKENAKEYLMDDSLKLLKALFGEIENTPAELQTLLNTAVTAGIEQAIEFFRRKAAEKGYVSVDS